jgi:hypothetical protein
MEPTQPHSNGSLTGPYDIRRLAAAVEALKDLIFSRRETRRMQSRFALTSS